MKAIFFDFGGTLYSYVNKDLGLGNILRELASKLKIELTPDVVWDLSGTLIILSGECKSISNTVSG